MLNRARLLQYLDQDRRNDQPGTAAPTKPDFAEAPSTAKDSLANLVQAIREEFPRASSPFAATGEKQVPPVPLEVVSAFVDGALSADEERVIETRLRWDDELLIELVSAGLSIRQNVGATTSLIADSVPDDLRARLMQMNPTSQQSPPVETVAAPIQIVPVARTQSARTQKQSKLPSHSRGKRRLWMIGAAVAATVMLAVAFEAFLGRPAEPLPQRIDMVEVAPPVDREDPRSVEPATPPRPQRPEPEVPQSSIANLPPETVAPETPATQEPTENVMATVPEPSTSIDPLPQMPLPEIPLPEMPQPGLKLRFEAIQGVVAVQPTQQNQRPASEQESLPRWASAIEGQTITWNAETSGSADRVPGDRVTGGPLTLQTLPLSRAELRINDDTRFIVAGDSRMDIGDGGVINLRVGAFALFADSSRDDSSRDDRSEPSQPPPLIRLNMPVQQASSDTSLTIETDSPGTLVVFRETDALRLQIVDGRVVVNGQSLAPGTWRTVVDPGKAEVGLSAVDDATDTRPPGWVSRPVERLALNRTFLAQLQTSDDLVGELSGQIRQIQTGQNLPRGAAASLPTLCRWQAACMDQHLNRLMGVDNPALRLAAFERLLATPPSDPRHDIIWSSIGNQVRDVRTLRTIRASLAAIWNSPNANAPSKAQLTQNLLVLLQSNSLANRAMADFLLRQFYSGGPPFDPQWTGAPQTRGVALWRTWISNR